MITRLQSESRLAEGHVTVQTVAFCKLLFVCATNKSLDARRWIIVHMLAEEYLSEWARTLLSLCLCSQCEVSILVSQSLSLPDDTSPPGREGLIDVLQNECRQHLQRWIHQKTDTVTHVLATCE